MSAADRVREFLDIWEEHQSRSDVIYGLGALRDGAVKQCDLTVSDLRELLDEPST